MRGSSRGRRAERCVPYTGEVQSSRRLLLLAGAFLAAAALVALPAPSSVTALAAPPPPVAPLVAPAPPANDAWIEVGDGTIPQGGRVTIRVRYPHAAAPPDLVQGTFRGEELRFLQERDHAWAVAGVEPWADPGPATVSVRILSQDGTVQEGTTAVQVTPVTWPTYTLALDADLNRLLGAEVVEAETRRLDALLAGYTPLQRWEGAFQQPSPGAVTSRFGERRAFGSGPPTAWHVGTDVAAPSGQAIRAAADGVVVFADALDIRGNTVVLDHGLGVMTVYAHMLNWSVQPGQRVEKGQVIGQVGSTGRSTGPHLHWEVRVRGVPTDPAVWVQGAAP